VERGAIDDPIRARAQEMLVQAPTVRTARILLDQYHGAFSRALETICSAYDQADVVPATQSLKKLALYAALGRHLINPWQVAVLGAPNVGKSSLINALAGYERSIVSATPGTTRDVIRTLVAIDGWPVELCDTAGLRDRAGELETRGIERARKAAEHADLCLWILDASSPPAWPALADPRTLLVINKTDLPAVWDTSQVADACHVSARTGAGIYELCQSISSAVVPHAPEPGAGVPFTMELGAALEDAADGAARGDFQEARRILGGCRLLDSSSKC
jgi:tRNA modification GTPase